MKTKSLRTRFAVLLLPLTFLTILIAAFSIAVIRYLVAELPERSVELTFAQELEGLADSFNLLNDTFQRVADDRERFVETFAFEFPLLERLDNSLAAAGIYDRLPALGEKMRELLHEGEALRRGGPSDERIARWLQAADELRRTAIEAVDEFDADMLAQVAEVQRQARVATWTLGVGMVIGLLLTGILAYRLGARVLQPIETFIDSARRIGTGDEIGTVIYEGNDEFAYLAQAFSEMSARLESYHRRLNKKAQIERDRMSRLLEHLPFPVLFFSASGEQVVTSNCAGSRLLEAPEIAGTLPEELRRLVAEVAETGKARSPTKLDAAVFLHAHNDELAFLPRAFPLSIGDETERGVVLVLIDVTKIRLSADLRSDLIAIISHELKTPLTSARVALHVILDESREALTAEQRELLETVRGEIERHLRTIENLLDLSMLQKGSRDLARRPVAVHELLSRIDADWRGPAREKRVELIWEWTGKDNEIEIDPIRFRIALGCLLANALRASPEGGRIYLRVLAAENPLRVEVIDEGEGIPEMFHETVFHRFFRLPDDRHAGEGLGLSVAREIVRAHGGDISLRSAPGEGSAFEIALPGAVMISADSP
ncbi:MAG: ATP-binding protein [Opitutales bacterium]